MKNTGNLSERISSAIGENDIDEMVKIYRELVSGPQPTDPEFFILLMTEEQAEKVLSIVLAKE